MAARSRPAYWRSSLLLEFGRRVRELRKCQGLSQEELGHLAGRHWTFVSQAERGERNVTIITLRALAVALEVDPGVLVTRDEKTVRAAVETATRRPKTRTRTKGRVRSAAHHGLA
ncbi:MAG TPA: helix-turn-helix transcriptional regulator [Planctomycetota bacterium]|jgi:transcriptional regulator with XRE-family HTH domain|nr:helix-turn-helix transcriptional regulator [Planctomycetota bacterium]